DSSTPMKFLFPHPPAILMSMDSEATPSETAGVTLFQGTITSPDQSPTAVPLTQCSLTSDGNFQFRVVPNEVSNGNYSFRGKREADRILGELEQNNAKLPLVLQRVDTVPEEGEERLGADSAWQGELDLVVRKIGVRFRVYDSPPFASPDAPRLLFDSLTEKVNGFPVKLGEGDNGQALLSIPSLPGNAKYFAKLDPTLDRIRGRFLQSLLPLTLELTRVKELQDRPADSDPLVRWIQREIAKKGTADSPTMEASKEASPDAIGSSKQNSLPGGIREEAFDIEQVDYRKPKEKVDGRWLHPKFRISGTITWPAGATAESKLPAVVMISGSGPQDRDETIGPHKPFRVLAHWFAQHGVASLRYDDRGVGDSTGDFLSSTTSDFAEDALAVWQHAKSVPGIDALRVGMLGHSEGGIIAPMVAAIQLDVAFQILLAPPGLSGSDVLSSQIDRMAELQGVDLQTRQGTLALQRKLQELALAMDPDDDKVQASVRQAVLEHWDALKGMSANQAGESEESLRKRVIDQIALQFQGLQSPWMRYFLAYDPVPNWLMMRSPTLAIWGDKDSQVLASINRERLAPVVERNPKLPAELIILPEINHLMQRASTGLPDEYARIQETIDPSVLDVILEWMNQRNLIP
nr:alpha/beta hydrolase [Pirellula sp.]